MGKQMFFKLRRWHKAKEEPPKPLKIMSEFYHPLAPKEYKSPFECGQAFGHFLKKKGYEKIGSGSYSTVYGKKDSDRVLKVCHRLDAWMEYITWAAQKGYCGTFAPRVYSYKYFPGNSSPFYVAVVERLDQEVGRVEETHPQAFTYHAFKWASRNAANDNVQKVLEVLSPGLSKFTEDFKVFGNNQEHDYHCGNFMVRKDGSWVATDPIMGHAKAVENRLRSTQFNTMRLAA